MRANAFWAATHPCYIGGGKYQCDCGHISIGIKDHNTHVISNHDKEFARKNLDWAIYQQTYEPEKYKQTLMEIKERRKKAMEERKRLWGY